MRYFSSFGCSFAGYRPSVTIHSTLRDQKASAALGLPMFFVHAVLEGRFWPWKSDHAAAERVKAWMIKERRRKMIYASAKRAGATLAKADG